jgi:ketosteroid isomerase-like protein
MTQPVQVVEAWRNAYARRDWQAAFATMHEDIEILEAPSLPYGGMWRGHQQARELHERVRAHWAELPLYASRAQLFDLGEFDRGQLVMLVDEIVSPLAGGGQTVLRLPLVELIFVRGDRISEIRVFYFDTGVVIGGGQRPEAVRRDGDLFRRPPVLLDQVQAPELEVMNRYRRLCAERDFQGLAQAVLAPDIEVHEADGLPYGGRYRGAAGYADLFRKVSECWEHLPLTDNIEQTVVAGPDSGSTLVVVLDSIRSRVRESGIVLDMPLVELLWISGGRISAIRPYYFDTTAISEAHQR